MSLPPEDPTRPLGQPAARPPEPVYRETVVGPDDELLFRTEVMDRLAGLRTWLAFVTLLSIAAIALAALAYFGGDDDGNGARGDGVRNGAVQALEQRVKALEGNKGDGVSPADLDAVRDENAALADRVEDLAGQVSAASDAPAAAEDAAARESIEALDASVRDLDARVQALEEQAAP